MTIVKQQYPDNALLNALSYNQDLMVIISGEIQADNTLLAEDYLEEEILTIQDIPQATNITSVPMAYYNVGEVANDLICYLNKDSIAKLKTALRNRLNAMGITPETKNDFLERLAILDEKDAVLYTLPRLTKCEVVGETNTEESGIIEGITMSFGELLCFLTIKLTEYSASEYADCFQVEGSIIVDFKHLVNAVFTE